MMTFRELISPRFVSVKGLKLFLLTILLTVITTTLDVFFIAQFSDLKSIITSFEETPVNTLLFYLSIYLTRFTIFLITSLVTIKYIYGSAFQLTIDGIRNMLFGSIVKDSSDRSTVFVDPEICATRYYKGILNIICSILGILILSLSSGLIYGTLFIIWIFIISILILPFYFIFISLSRKLSYKRSLNESRHQLNVNNIFTSVYDFYSLTEPVFPFSFFESNLKGKYNSLILYNFIVGSYKSFLEALFLFSLFVACTIGYFIGDYSKEVIVSFFLGMLYFGFRALPVISMALQARSDIEFGVSSYRALLKPNYLEFSTSSLSVKIVEKCISVRLGEFSSRFDFEKSLEVPFKSVVGLVGKIGSGKSYFLRALCSAFNNIKSRPFVDSYNYHHSKFVCPRAAYVGARGFIFSGSLLDNIFPFSPLSEYERNSLILPIINEYFPDFTSIFQIDDISKHGLSTGQQCLVSILRAYFSDSEILCLDEPTSSMDLELEESFCRFLVEMKVNRTIFIVTHRQRPLQFCTQVLTISTGR